LVQRQQALSDKDLAPNAGQVLVVEQCSNAEVPFLVTLRQGRPYLVNEGRVNVRSGDTVEKGDIIGSEDLVVPRTTDIVQGLPRINKLFEASGAGLKSRLEELWKLEKLSGLSDFRAALAARDKFQMELVSEIQGAYLAQGVSIMSKHIEIVVKKMTETCKVLDGGGVTLSEDGLERYCDVEALQAVLGSSEIRVMPMLRGITQVGLDAHIMVAMGFREVDNVLTRAVLYGPMSHPMQGIKENLMVGKAISVGQNSDDAVSSKLLAVYRANQFQLTSMLSPYGRSKLEELEKNTETQVEIDHSTAAVDGYANVLLYGSRTSDSCRARGFLQELLASTPPPIDGSSTRSRVLLDFKNIPEWDRAPTLETSHCGRRR